MLQPETYHLLHFRFFEYAYFYNTHPYSPNARKVASQMLTNNASNAKYIAKGDFSDHPL